MLNDFLKNGKCFKLICGAGNEDTTEVENLVAIYSKAGCRFFDISANKDVIKSAKLGIEKSGETKNRYICVSIGTKDDIHLSKAYIKDEKCINCGKCLTACPRQAIQYEEKQPQVDEKRCIGCQKCIKICPKKAIKIQKNEKNTEYRSFLSSVDCIEFHISSKNEKEILAKWDFLNKNFSGILSICISRKFAGDEKLIKLLSKMLSNRKPYTTIIQADGNPMTGGKDDYQTTLQAVAISELIQKQQFPVYLFASGGTNTKTFKLAHLCNVELCGIATGSFARKEVKEYLKIKNLTENKGLYQEACNKAKKIIKSFLELV